MQVLVVRKRRSSIPVGSTSCRCRWSSPRPLAMWAAHHAQAEMMGSLVSTTATIVRWIWSLLCLHITTGTIWRYESAKRVKTTLAQLPESGDVALPSLLSPPRRDRHTLPMPHRLSADRAPPPLFSASRPHGLPGLALIPPRGGIFAPSQSLPAPAQRRPRCVDLHPD